MNLRKALIPQGLPRGTNVCVFKGVEHPFGQEQGQGPARECDRVRWPKVTLS